MWIAENIIITLFWCIIGIIAGACCEHKWLMNNFCKFISEKFHLTNDELESLKKEFNNTKWN